MRTIDSNELGNSFAKTKETTSSVAMQISYQCFHYATFGAWLCMVLKLGRFGQQIRNTWKVLKCGAGEGRSRSVGPIM